jgi:hypothetical protein
MKLLSVTLAVPLLVLGISTAAAQAQRSGATTIKGNTDINVSASNMTAVAAGSGNVARNRVGVIQGDKQGNTKITAHVGNVTNVAAGHNRKSCINIGSVVSNECK